MINHRATEIELKAKMVVIRHGQTMWNRLGILIGQQDIPLDSGGRQEARAAVRSLTGIDAIYSSPLVRCTETAGIIGGYFGLPVTLLKGLSERRWGVFEGRPKLERDLSKDPEGGENTEEFRARVVETLPHLVGARPLIVTHSGVIRLLCADPTAVIPHAEPIELPFEKVARLRP
jgi:broad specificity phosphatase PhoE